MVNTSLSIFSNNRLSHFLKHLGLFLLMALVLVPDVFAQAGGTGGGNQTAGGLCEVAGWIKTILTAAAIIAVLLYILNSFFMKSSVIGDIMLYVLIGCTIAVSVVYLIGLTGLTPTCSI